MVIHYTNIYNNVVFPGKKACIFRFKGRKSCANGDSVTLEFMISDYIAVGSRPGCYHRTCLAQFYTNPPPSSSSFKQCSRDETFERLNSQADFHNNIWNSDSVFRRSQFTQLSEDTNWREGHQQCRPYWRTRDLYLTCCLRELSVWLTAH